MLSVTHVTYIKKAASAIWILRLNFNNISINCAALFTCININKAQVRSHRKCSCLWSEWANPVLLWDFKKKNECSSSETILPERHHYSVKSRQVAPQNDKECLYWAQVMDKNCRLKKELRSKRPRLSWWEQLEFGVSSLMREVFCQWWNPTYQSAHRVSCSSAVCVCM